MNPILFKFKPIDENGNEQGMFAQKGSFDGELLRLADAEIPIASLMGLERRDQVMALMVQTEEGPVQFIIKIQGSQAEKLHRAINIVRSRAWGEIERELLRKQGQEHLYREDICPLCDSTIILTRLPQTPQVFCPFCDSLWTRDDPALHTREKAFRLCDECSMFSQPRKFTVFYFYFLVVFFGVHAVPTWRCPGCMRREAWKMLAGNLLFVLGVPFALVQLARSYGGNFLPGPYRGLDQANIYAQKGRLDRAVAGYRDILERVPTSAGIKFNLGHALMKSGRVEEASSAFALSLKDCANYLPSLNGLVTSYLILERHEDANQILATYGMNEAPMDALLADNAAESESPILPLAEETAN